jgi:hypothetical protein
MTTFALSRRRVLVTVALGAVSGVAHYAFAASQLPKVKSYRNPGCDCCERWVKHLQKAGFDFTMSDDPKLNARKPASQRLLPWSQRHLHSSGY